MVTSRVRNGILHALVRGSLEGSRLRYLKILAADKACVHVDWTERHRATLFKVKIQILHSKTQHRSAQH